MLLSYILVKYNENNTLFYVLHRPLPPEELRTIIFNICGEDSCNSVLTQVKLFCYYDIVVASAACWCCSYCWLSLVMLWLLSLAVVVPVVLVVFPLVFVVVVVCCNSCCVSSC